MIYWTELVTNNRSVTHSPKIIREMFMDYFNNEEAAEWQNKAVYKYLFILIYLPLPHPEHPKKKANENTITLVDKFRLSLYQLYMNL